MGVPYVAVHATHVTFEWAYSDMRLALFVSSIPNDSSWVLVQDDQGSSAFPRVTSGLLDTLPMAALREAVER